MIVTEPFKTDTEPNIVWRPLEVNARDNVKFANSIAQVLLITSNAYAEHLCIHQLTAFAIQLRVRHMAKTGLDIFCRFAETCILRALRNFQVNRKKTR